jgi:phosphoribosylanthranilate isomerase
MRTRVKICRIASLTEAELAVRHGADALGLAGAMPSGPGPIDDETIAVIAAHVEATGASTVQIVSHIEPDQSARLARLLPRTRRVQVIHVEGPDALDLIPAYAGHVHAFLLDSGRPSLSVPKLGGTGRAHDWSVSAAFVKASPHPVFLAGGLNPGNAREAIRAVQPYGIDLCTGVRTNGDLDVDKLSAFMTAVRAADGDA